MKKDRTTNGTYPWSFVTQRYSVTVNQVMEATENFRSDDFYLTTRNPWKEAQALEYRINCEIYTPGAGAAEMSLHINGNFTMGKLKSS
jgi:hypothetical protein